MEMIGIVLALLGAALAVTLSGIGSALGVMKAAQATTGVVAEDPDKFSRCLVLTLLPATQGLYGFIIGILVLVKIGGLGDGFIALSKAGGIGMLFSCLPMAFCGLTSAMFQARAAVASIGMVAKRPEESGKGMTVTALIELYALLGLLTSILAIMVPNWEVM